MKKIYIMDRDAIAKEIIPYLHKDVYPILTNEISSKTKGKIWIVSKEVQERTGIESAIVYEELLGKLVEYSYRMFTYNWDYFYLNNKIVEASKAETLILGSSYARFGINEEMMENAVNLSLSSQDWYYAFELLKKVCSKPNHIKNVILGCGYYTAFADLSRTKNIGELTRISSVYAPILNDWHNCFIHPANRYAFDESDYIDVQKLVTSLYNSSYGQHSYFDDENRKRCYFQTKLWEDQSKYWNDLSEAEKWKYGKQRAESHNKSIRYEETLQENIKIMKEIAVYASENKMHLILTVFPATIYYQTFFDMNFREYFYDALEQVNEEIHLVDCFGDPFFDEEDFNDTDHLNDSGATKMTLILNQLLQQVNE